MKYPYKNQLHIDSVSITDSGKCTVDFVFPLDETRNPPLKKINLKITHADYVKCKRAMYMQGFFPMESIADALGELVSAAKLGGK